MTGVYLLHLTRPVGHAKHYLGWSSDIDKRVATHARGRGNPLVRAAGGFELARVWEGAQRDDERKLKDRKNLRGVCPVCRPGYNREARDRMRAALKNSC